MACPLCGELCRCSYAQHTTGDAAADAGLLVDPEAWDDTEEQFAASISSRTLAVDEPARAADAISETGATAESSTVAVAEADPPAVSEERLHLSGIERRAREIGSRAHSHPEDVAAGDAWRDEVASRVHSYRARRRRGTPEGAMKFDFETSAAPAENVSRSEALERVTARFAARPTSDVLLGGPAAMPEAAEASDDEDAVLESGSECNTELKAESKPESKIIEFPRSATLLPFEELAEALPDSPRILDAPEPEELAPVMPTVAAITLDAEAEPLEPAPTGSTLELPMHVASISQRIFAALLDLVMVLLSLGIFAAIVLKIAGGVPESRLLAGFSLLIAAAFWTAYQYLFLGHNGCTPGMQFAHLAICDFSGSPPPPSRRRTRALAMLVSATPVGLGFFWALFDEEALCWHDRITRTCMVQK